MFKLYGNGIFMDKFRTKNECKDAIKEYKEINKIMFGKNDIKFKIIEVV